MGISVEDGPQVNSKHTPFVTYTRFPTLFAKTGEVHSATWDKFVEQLRPTHTTYRRKEDVPCVVLGKLTDGQALKASLAFTSAIGFDYDDGKIDFDAACDFWSNHCALAYTTWNHTDEHPRFRVLLRLNRPLLPNEHGRVWQHFANLLAKHGHTIDVHAANAERKWFVPAQPENGAPPDFRSWSGEVVDVDRILHSNGHCPTEEPEGRQEPETSPRYNAATTGNRIEETADRIGKTLNGQKNHEWNKDVYTLAGLFAAGRLDPAYDEDRILSILFAAMKSNSHNPNREWIKLQKSWNEGKNKPLHASRKSETSAKPTQRRGNEDEDEDERAKRQPWRKALRRGDKGQILNSADNFRQIFDNAEFTQRLVYDEFYDTIFHKSDEGKSIAFREYADIFRFNVWLSQEQLPELPLSGAFAMLHGYTELHHRQNALQSHLMALEWDGQPRLDTWLIRYLGAEDNEYTRRVGRMWLISAMARAFKPGCKADYMLVLESAEQGLGKSTALQVLGGDFFSDQISDLASKDASIDIQRVWIFEFGELDRMDRSDVGTIKSFVSRRKDNYRPPYARITIERPRHTIFAGTCNESEYLRDDTGNRRFWPVTIHGTDLRALERDRDALLAEARRAFEEGERWWPDEPMTALAKEEQELRRISDPWEDVIGQYILNKNQVTTSEILTHIGVERHHQSPALSRRVVSILTSRLGFASHMERRRETSGKVSRIYKRM